jgi:hypothetical protein
MGDAASRRVAPCKRQPGVMATPSRDVPVQSPFWGPVASAGRAGEHPRAASLCAAPSCAAPNARRAASPVIWFVLPPRRVPGRSVAGGLETRCCDPAFEPWGVRLQEEVSAGAGRPHPSAPWPWPRRQWSSACGRSTPSSVLWERVLQVSVRQKPYRPHPSAPRVSPAPGRRARRATTSRRAPWRVDC